MISPAKPLSYTGFGLAQRSVVTTVAHPVESDPDRNQSPATNEHQSQRGGSRSSTTSVSSIPVTDALLLFLPEEPDSVVAGSNLREPSSWDVQSKPSVLTDSEPSRTRPAVATRPGIDDSLRPQDDPRRNLLLRWRNTAARLVPSVLRMVREQVERLKRRSAAVSSLGARWVRLVGAPFVTGVRATRRGFSDTARLAMAGLTRHIVKIEGARSTGRNSRVAGQSDRVRLQPNPHQTRVRCSYPPAPRYQWPHRAIAWVNRLSSVRTFGLNTWPIGFICGMAIGALGMWLFSVPSVAQRTTVAGEGMPAVTTEPVSEVAARVGSVSGAALVAPTVDSAVPANWANRDQSGSRAAARPPTRFRGTLAVSSWPPGARVFVNDEAVGTTPVVLAALPVGSRVVRIEAEGYQLWSSAVQVVANQQTRVTATLYRELPQP